MLRLVCLAVSCQMFILSPNIEGLVVFCQNVHFPVCFQIAIHSVLSIFSFFLFSALSVRGEVQNPLACLLNCEITMDDVYLDVPRIQTVKLLNQTLLPTHFEWGQVRRKSFLCDKFPTAFYKTAKLGLEFIPFLFH